MLISPLNRVLLIILFIGNSLNVKAQINSFTIKSPDKKVSATIFTDKQGLLQYRVDYKKIAVINQSRMGLLVNGFEIGSAKKLRASKAKVIQKQFAWRGVHSKAIYHATTATVFTGPVNSTNTLAIEVQAFNTGIAFRYVMPDQGQAKITRELTTFNIPEKAENWWQGDIHNYEGTYSKSTAAGIKSGQVIGMPITVVLPNNKGFAAITEANVNNYAGMYLVATGTSVFATALDGEVNLDRNVTTPWRVISIGPDLNSVVNNDIIACLSPEPDSRLFPEDFDTEWIKPGKSVWSWMTAVRAVTPENMRRFTDLAAQCGIPYNLVDDGWGRWEAAGKDNWQLLRELVDYSAAKNVKIWVWAAYPNNNGIAGLKDSFYMKEFFKNCRQAGVAGVKIDFMSSESQNLVDFYNRASREAAKQHLMIDYHGASKPSGQSRTWPNELSREAVRGLEYSDDTDWPSHNTIIPFTRYLAGHGDYTPLSTAKFVSSTTLPHQVATMVTFTSPFLCLGVDPADLLKSEALPFVRAIPSVWDETVVLPPSEIGEVCVMARRSGTKWFLAVLNNKQARNISVPLSFLSYKAHSYQFMGNKQANTSAKGTVTNKDKFNIDLGSGDGFIAMFD
ncbi:glycoside hydrolase family 97 protein [Mucilaginibacter pallidiroseus]|uniref:Glycoside hydrolase family 97 protein n=1 Tax=Mucilaginibacter pallidiroseus TaxID=2599295 RepID=A0A563UI69_9SPHI|nr:glycoside hydrolase family 97 protein [Mucilaginibacter pallidiroseus]TWR30948.1 glycoside hydrolase family 97 protein [Mucilaginibacter pallidiroseus]